MSTLLALLTLGCSSGTADGSGLPDRDGDGVDAAADCDDTDAAVHPGAEESCNGHDDDCDGDIDEDAADASLLYDDRDHDTYGDGITATRGCPADDGRVFDGTDCNDARADVHPDADERCDNIDEDCDGEVDEDPIDGHAYPVDADLDRYGDPVVTSRRCRISSGVTADNTDCNDSRADVYPGALESCDGVDDDCDGAIDEDAWDETYWYEDHDGDGHGVLGTSVAFGCTGPDGTISLADDCDDTDPEIYALHPELCDGKDNDCTAGTTDRYTATWFKDGQPPIDLVAALAAGEDGAPVALTVDGGSFNNCGATLYVNLTVIADTTFTAFEAYGIYDGGGTGSVMTVVGDGIHVTGSFLDISNGRASVYSPDLGSLDGGGIACVGDSSIDLEFVDIHDSEADHGALLFTEGCTVSMYAGWLYFGEAAFGGAIYGWGGGSIRLEALDIDYNYASDLGGGIELNGVDGPMSLDLVNTSFDGNLSNAGGAIALRNGVTATCTETIPTGSWFTRNSVWSEGGAVYLDSAAGDVSFEASACDFSEPDASDNTPSDIWVDALATRYSYGDTATFRCTGAGCE